jgi:hypothetical protein
MKFIIPQNYNFKNKIFGIIDYSTVFFNIIWYLIIFLIINFLLTDWNIKIFLIISLCFPITLFSIVGFNGEPIVYVFKYVIKYIFRPKLYLYKKNL